MFSCNGRSLSKVFITMFINRNLFSFILPIVLVIVQANHIAINWNLSTHWGNSYIEREYKYPMYEEVAPVPCDLTDSCDVFCRQDADCNESQRLSFEFNRPDKNCNGYLSYFDCDCDEFDKPEWLSVLCYVYKNPIYLGRFFRTPKKIEKFSAIKSHTSKIHHFINHDQEKGVKAKVLYQYGSPVMTFVPVSDSFPSVNNLMVRTAVKDTSYACKSTPVRYRINQTSNCLTKVNEESCHTLSMFPYLVQGSNQSSYNMPIVLKDFNVLKGIETEVVIKCMKLTTTTKKLKKKESNYYNHGGVKSCVNSPTMHAILVNNSCQNVLVFVRHEFILNGSDTVKLKVEYGLGDVPLPVDYTKYKYNYIKQKFSVSFFDVMVKSSDYQNYSKDDELLNRGYFVGEELNFGYKGIKNNKTTWTKGLMGFFKNGDSCDVSPATFGFNHFSICHVRKNFSTCSQLRREAEDKFESLLKGDSLAVYQNLRPPFSNSLPVLRGYKNIKNNSQCEIPTVQHILIKYTTIRTNDGKLIHRILGARIDRLFQNITAPLSYFSLTSKISFLFVSSPSEGEENMSRFWIRMYSPEQSENSWLHIFNGFDDVTTDEREEITFWSILLLGLISAVGIFTKLDFSFSDLV